MASITLPETAASPMAEARDATIQVLRQVEALVERLSAEQYVLAPVGPVHSSMASHVRHCLDHVGAWLDACRTGILDYDHRERGTPVERDPRAALRKLRSQIDELERLDSLEGDEAWTMAAQVIENGPALEMRTSPLRELAFVLSHTIHHNALIGVMARLLEVPAPERFGYAPATLSFLHAESAACAH